MFVGALGHIRRQPAAFVALFFMRAMICVVAFGMFVAAAAHVDV